MIFGELNSWGRGFADEVFRVFQEEHPEIKITPLHASTTMLAMILPSRRKTTINDIYRFLVNRYNRKSGHLSLISYYIEEKEQGKWGFI